MIMRDKINWNALVTFMENNLKAVSVISEDAILEDACKYASKVRSLGLLVSINIMDTGNFLVTAMTKEGATDYMRDGGYWQYY